jgi:alkaline phosphatase
MLLKSTHLLGACLVLAAAAALPAQAQSTNNNVIMYIGDGFGLAPKTATRMALGQGRDGKRLPSEAGFQGLNLDKLKYNATVTTQLLDY